VARPALSESADARWPEAEGPARDARLVVTEERIDADLA